MISIVSSDTSFIVDGAPIARGGEETSCGAKLTVNQQAFVESGFGVGSIVQAAPLQFAKSNSDSLFAGLTDNELNIEGDQYESNTVLTDQDGNLISEDQRQDWIAGPSRGIDSDLTKPVYSEKLNGNRRPGYGDHGKFFEKPTSRPYNPGRAWSNEKLEQTARVYGKQSETGKQAIEELENRGELVSYRAKQEQIVKNRTQNIATRAAQKLDVKNTPPPSLNNEFGYENPMAKVRDRWKGEAADGIKKSGVVFDNAGRQVSPQYDAGRSVVDNVINKNNDALKDQAIDKATGTGKSKIVEKAKDIAPKRVRQAWDTYDDYNAVKEKGSDIQNAIPKDD